MSSQIQQSQPSAIYNMSYNFSRLIGPTLFVVAIFYLRNKPTCLYIFVFGFILNPIINLFLKKIIKQPRPNYNKNLEKAFKIKDNLGEFVPADNYGMPSGHANLIFYTTTYLYLITHDMNLLVFTVILSILTSIQRVVYKKHTIEQVVVGGIIGIGLGYFFYYYCEKTIKEKNIENIV